MKRCLYPRTSLPFQEFKQTIIYTHWRRLVKNNGGSQNVRVGQRVAITDKSICPSTLLKDVPGMLQVYAMGVFRRDFTGSNPKWFF